MGIDTDRLINDEFPDHAHEDPDDSEFVERVSSPDDFVDPVEEGE